MKQSLHILRKDVRYLGREISLTILLCAAMAWIATRPMLRLASTQWIEIVIIAASVFLIARVIHAEPIPGDRQFWITRPYRWRSLLTAKILFTLAFVNTPILLAQVTILLVSGFPLRFAIAGLLWCHVLFFAGVALPVAALASVTSGFVAFAFTAGVLLFIGLTVPSVLGHLGLLWFGPVEWIRDSIALIPLIAVSAVILLRQYKTRSTRASRVAGVLGLASALICYALVPWSTAFEAQVKLSRQRLAADSLALKLMPGSKTPVQWERLGFVEVDLPIEISGVPADLEVVIDAFKIILRSPDGKSWRSREQDNGTLRGYSLQESGRSLFHLALIVDRSFFDAGKEKDLKLDASIYFTAFGNTKTRVLPASEQAVDVDDGLQCSAGFANSAICRSAFRWPAKLVEARTASGRGQAMTRFLSYSPFPADPVLAPLEIRGAPAFISSNPPIPRDVTIVVKEPLTHVRRDLHVENFRLTNFAFTASR